MMMSRKIIVIILIIRIIGILMIRKKQPYDSAGRRRHGGDLRLFWKSWDFP